MADRLIQAGVKTEIGVFEGMLHGSLNLDVKIGVPECKKIVRFASSWLKNMLR